MSFLPPPTHCAGGCGRYVDPTSRLVYHEVSGWAQPRKGGGLNHLVAKNETGRYMCEECVRTMRDTGTAAQEQLFG